MLLAALYRGYLIAVLASGLLLNGGAGIAAARSLSPSAQLCAADAQALTSFAEQGPTLTPALRATVARLIVRYEHRRGHCGLSVHVPTGGGGYDSVSVMTVATNSHVALPSPAAAAATSTGGRHTLMLPSGRLQSSCSSWRVCTTAVAVRGAAPRQLSRAATRAVGWGDARQREGAHRLLGSRARVRSAPWWIMERIA